jgi:methyl-accepting chemotaxis protein
MAVVDAAIMERAMLLNRLSSLVGAVALLLLLPSASRADDATKSFDIEAKVALNGFEGLVEQQLGWALVSLKTVAASENAASGDWARLKGPLATLAAGMPSQAAVWFARPDGSYYSVEKGLTDQNIGDRSYFPGLLGGKDVVGELVVSKSTGKKAAVIATPILRDGKAIGALGISVGVENLSAFVEEKLHFPADVVFYALDRQGQSALHRNSKLMFEFPSEMGSPSLASAVRTMLSEPEGTVSYDFNGKKKLVIFQKSKMTGWVFAVGAEK